MSSDEPVGVGAEPQIEEQNEPQKTVASSTSSENPKEASVAKTSYDKRNADPSVFASRMSRLTTIPSDLMSPAILRRLELEYNELVSLPVSLSALVNLEWLDFSHNRATVIEDDGVANLTRLTHLDLGFNLLTSIPISLSNLVNLEFFSVCKNRLTSWPDAMLSWNLAKSISLAGNNFGENMHLETLNADHFPNLTFLDIGENSIDSIPSELSTLTSLTSLDLSINCLTSWPTHFSSLSQLNRIDLTINDFTEIPENITTDIYPHLTELILSSNAIDILKLDKKIPDFCRLGSFNAPTLIVPGLFLGNIESCYNKHKLIQLNVSHVVSIIENPPPHPTRFTYLNIQKPDIESTDLYSHFDEACQFIDSAIIQAGRACLVHCQAGMSRSATIVIAWIMKTFKLTAEDAEDFVREKRPIILPNKGFRMQLQQWEDTLRKRKVNLLPPGSAPNPLNLTPWMKSSRRVSSGSDSKCTLS